jgi:hypothetical protein
MLEVVLEPIVFPDNYPDHRLRGEAKGIEHVLQERCLLPENNRWSDGHRSLLQCLSHSQ